MSVSGIGSVNSYIYNMKTGKLSTKDGSEDEFVDYFNGDLAGKDSTDLNGYDAHRKRDIEAMIRMFEMGLGKHLIENSEGDEIEITDEVVDAATSVYSINGEQVFTAYTALTYSKAEEIDIFGTMRQPFKTHHGTGYDPLTNRLSIGVGDVIDFGNGYRFTVEEDRVVCTGFRNDGSEEDTKARAFASGLEALIHFGDQQTFSERMYLFLSTDMVLEFLNQMGVDTGREFIINDTRCEVVNGKVREVGNNYLIPSSIREKALERYEQQQYTPMNAWTDWDERPDRRA